MLNLFKSDIYKLSKSKAFFISMLVCIFLTFMSVVIIYYTTNGNSTSASSGISVSVSEEAMKSDKSVINNVKGYLDSADLFFYISIFISVFINMEFSSGAIKNIASKGYNRSYIYISKLITCFISTLILIVISLLTMGIATYAFYGLGDINSNLISDALIHISKQVSMYLAMTSVFVTLAYIFKKNTPCIAIMIILVNILPMVAYTLRNKFSHSEYLITYSISKIDSLSVNPYLLSVMYIIISIVVGCTIFKKQDIK